jgi:hypothetical protein
MSKKTFPSEADAEFMLEWYKALNSAWFSGNISPRVRKIFNQCEKKRMDLHHEIFGPDGRWSLTIDLKKRYYITKKE